MNFSPKILLNLARSLTPFSKDSSPFWKFPHIFRFKSLSKWWCFRGDFCSSLHKTQSCVKMFIVEVPQFTCSDVHNKQLDFCFIGKRQDYCKTLTSGSIWVKNFLLNLICVLLCHNLEFHSKCKIIVLDDKKLLKNVAQITKVHGILIKKLKSTYFGPKIMSQKHG